MSSVDLERLLQDGFPRSHPGVDLIQTFVDEGEYSIVDVIEAWRTCAAVAAAFLEITPKELLRCELRADIELDESPQRVRDHVRKKLVGDPALELDS